MLPVQAAISRVRRDLTLSRMLKLVLAGCALVCFAAAMPENVRFAALVGLAAIWFWLSLNSARGSRAAAASPSLIASGRFDEAERNIEQTVKTFSIFRAVKLQALHNLALLRHAQRRWADSAELSRALLRQRLGALQTLSKPARLLLADSLLEMNDLLGAHDALTALHQERLNLAEVLNLLVIQLDYLARIGAWDEMLQNVMKKVQFTELMPSGSSARSQAFLAMAAGNSNRPDLRDWLRARAELLADPATLSAQRPMLRSLWES